MDGFRFSGFAPVVIARRRAQALDFMCWSPAPLARLKSLPRAVLGRLAPPFPLARSVISSVRWWGGNGGAKRDRTADLLHAMQALSQLSYGPVPIQGTGLVHGPTGKD
jgi:hypothetical protein